MLPADIHQFLVNVNHHNPIDILILSNLPDGCSFSAADNANTPWIRMAKHGWVDEAFVVNKLVLVG